MESVGVGRSESSRLDGGPAGGCRFMCGMCPPCVLAPRPPASFRCLWKPSDEFRRRFMVKLLLWCTNTRVLQSLQDALGVTSWSFFTDARSRSPVLPEDYPHRGAQSPLLVERPVGLDLKEIRDWFLSSPDWVQYRYLCRLFFLCDPELLRMLANLTSVLLVRQKRGVLQFNVSRGHQHHQDSDEDSEDPALMVVPGSSRSMSGVSLHRDFISCLPVHLAKRILGLLDQQTLSHCQKVCQRWKHLAQETAEEAKFRRHFQDQITAMMKRCDSINIASSTYASMVDVPVPDKEDEKVDIHRSVQKVETFEAAYAKIRTKMVPMEERNVYCGAYYTTTLLDKEDPHRVVDFRGGLFMATGSKDRSVRLIYVVPETQVVSVLKGHVGSVRVVLLCEDRRLLITGSCDASIRCWCLKTDRCVMMLYGHSTTVNCLDIYAETLVSGAKDCLVKVWSLQTGKRFADCNFKHQSPVQCVKINRKTVFSSCDRGLVKVWDLENPSLIRVIDAHKTSVKCLFIDEWHILSGDSSGQVKAWSINSDAKESLMTFNHPKEVRSLTLVYLRVLTGCVDGMIRIFNFLTGDCLREITAEAEAGRIVSMHFSENRILVNAITSVKLYQFGKVFWDYGESTEGGQGEVEVQDCLVSEKSAASLRKFPSTAVRADRSQKIHNSNKKKPKRAELLSQDSYRAPARERCETAKRRSVTLSEKATNERMKRRGLHHPLSRDSILLRVNAKQRAMYPDEVTVNMENNARLRDSWGPNTSQDHVLQTQKHGGGLRRAQTCVPILKRTVSQNATQSRDISTAPNARTGRHPWFSSQPISADEITTRETGLITGSTERCMRSLPKPEPSMKIQDRSRRSPQRQRRTHGGPAGGPSGQEGKTVHEE